MNARITSDSTPFSLRRRRYRGRARRWRGCLCHSSCRKSLSNLCHPDLELFVNELPFRIKLCVTKLRQKCSEISLVLFFELEVGQKVVVELHSQVARVV